MAEKPLTRRNLDRLAISFGGRFVLGCTEHPDDGATAIYQNGDLRLVCPTCGFEAARVKVADLAPNAQPSSNEERLRQALAKIEHEAVDAPHAREIARAALLAETP